MNAREASELLGVSEATVSRLASGDRRPSLELITEIHRLLGWGIEEQVELLTTSTTAYGEEFQKRMAATTVEEPPHKRRTMTEEDVDAIERVTGVTLDSWQRRVLTRTVA